MVRCKSIGDELRHQMYEEIECWRGLHILHGVTGIIAFIIYITACLIISLCFFESKLSSADPSARSDSRNEFWSMVFKSVCCILATFFITNDYRWVNTIVFTIGSIVLYIKQRMERPYYNEVINIIADVNNGIFIWSTLMLIVVMAAEDTNFNGGVQAFLMGIPLIIILLVTQNDHRKDMLLKGIENYDNGDQWYIKVRYYISFIQKKEMNRDTSVELKGYIYSHEEKCTIQNCPLRVYVTNINNMIKDNRRKKQSKTATENFVLLMRFANALFLQGLSKFPSCTSLRIAYAFFLKDKMNNRTLAINELLSAEKHHPAFDEQFLIYRYRKLIEDEMADVQTDNQTGTLDAISMIAYDNYMRQFKEATERSAYLHMEFWLEVVEPEPDLGKLDKTGSKIHLSIVVVEDYWAKLQKINANTPKALKLYAEFLIEILNDTEAGSELLSRAKDTVIARTTFNANALNAAEIMGMGDMCAGISGADGTPCIIASGDQGKIGEIVQFNLASCRIFGYTKTELNGMRINSLMPDIYAKSHDKILQKCINNNEDIEARSDFLVLGKHKSGYLIPLFLKTRILTSVTQGTLFAATFTLESKALDVCYLLLDPQEDVVGMSSKCISTLKLSNKLLRNSRVSFPTLAPGIKDSAMIDQYKAPNSGGMLQFFFPEYNNEEEVSSHNFKEEMLVSEQQSANSPTRKLRVRASKESLNLFCLITKVVILEESVGYLVRLQITDESKDVIYERKLDRGWKYPNIQFVFDPVGMRFTQEDSQDDAQKLVSDTTFMHVNIMRDRSHSGVSLQKSEESKSPEISMISGVNEITQLKQKLNARSYDEGVKTKRLVKGEEEYIEAKSRLVEKQMEEKLEEEEAKIREKNSNDKKEDIFQSSLKSKKAFNAALNEKSVPPSIKRLKCTGCFIGLAILTLVVVEFALLLIELRDIQENIDLIKYSRQRIAIQMKMTYYINKVVLLLRTDNPKIDAGALGETEIDMVTTAKKIMADSLNRYYYVQSKITLSKLTLSEENKRLYTEKSVTLHYRGTEGRLITKTYTLTEAIQQLASGVFTVHSFANTEANYRVGNDDIDFILYNSFADLYIKMSESANYFVKELKDRGSSKKIMVYILYAVGLFVAFINIIFLFPVVASVSKTRLEVLSLFLDIPQSSVKGLEKKAEKFVSKSNNEAVDDGMSNEGEMLTANGLAIEGTEIDIGRADRSKRKFKNNTTSNTTFYFQYFFAMIVVAGYFSFNFAYGYIFLTNMSKYSRELNATTGIQIETATSFSIYQNLIGNRRILKYTESETFDYIALRKIPIMYTIASEVQNSHNDYQKSFKKGYRETFIDIMRNNLCNHQHAFELSFEGVECASFLDGTLVEGLHPVIIHYIEQLRERLTLYRNYQIKYNSNDTEELAEMNQTLTDEFLSVRQFKAMERTIFEVIEFSIEYLINSLIGSYASQYDAEVTKRIIIFICFLIVFFIAFVFLWIPFTNKLNDEVRFVLRIDLENKDNAHSNSI